MPYVVKVEDYFLDKYNILGHGMDDDCIFDSIEDCESNINFGKKLILKLFFDKIPYLTILKQPTKVPDVKVVEYRNGKIVKNISYRRKFIELIYKEICDILYRYNMNEITLAHGYSNNLDYYYFMFETDKKPNVKFGDWFFNTSWYCGRCSTKDELVMLKLSYGSKEFYSTTSNDLRNWMSKFNSEI